MLAVGASLGFEFGVDLVLSIDAVLVLVQEKQGLLELVDVSH